MFEESFKQAGYYPEVPSFTRREFLRLSATSSLLAVVPSCWNSGTLPPRTFDIPGTIVGGNQQVGHLLREPRPRDRFPEPEAHTYDVAIVGGGVSGLCAAWKLKRAGMDDFVLLELESRLGGTAASGNREGAEFPWAAHYINVPPAEADCVKEVLSDLGIIEGYDEDGRPRIAEQHILRWPTERLFMDGRWIEWDLLNGASTEEREAILAFEDDMLSWTLYRGFDGRRAFVIPLGYSTTDSKVRQLDDISMETYVRSKGWNSPRLDWMINYACRDDYGGTMATVSAWAGIHYFACRYYDQRLRNEYPSDTLTWPAGNGFLVQRLAEGLTDSQYRLGSAVLRIDNEGPGVRIGYFDTDSQTYRSVSARTVVYAAKLHTAPFLVDGLPRPQVEAIESCEYSPWLTAAIHVNELPTNADVSIAWDNVLYSGRSLGYIVADHQSRKAYENNPSVLVYYLPFVEELDLARQKLLEEEHPYWVNVIMQDLLAAHPDLVRHVERIDVYRWGHAMIRPGTGIIWGSESAVRREPFGNVYFASCDTTGLPLFEEACFSGIRAAEQVMEHLGRTFETSINGLSAERAAVQ